MLRGGVQVNAQNINILPWIYMVIPQHLMDEISMNTGLTNVSTVNVSVQLTFDIARIDDNLNNNLGAIGEYYADPNNIWYRDRNTGKRSYLTHYIE